MSKNLPTIDYPFTTQVKFGYYSAGIPVLVIPAGCCRGDRSTCQGVVVIQKGEPLRFRLKVSQPNDAPLTALWKTAGAIQAEFVSDNNRTLINTGVTVTAVDAAFYVYEIAAVDLPKWTTFFVSLKLDSSLAASPIASFTGFEFETLP